MTREEFNTWLSDFQTRFPDSGAWIRRNAETVKLWYAEVFANLGLSDCIEANRELMLTDDPIRAYERETIPARVRHIARQIDYDRNGRANQEWKENAKRTKMNYEEWQKEISKLGWRIKKPPKDTPLNANDVIETLAKIEQ